MFVREIPGYASARGEAWVRAEGEDLARYEESAQVVLAEGGTLQGTQCYLYRRLGADGLEIQFCESGKMFERLTFREQAGGRLEAVACCVCGADEYVSQYRLEGSDRLEVKHRVKGPRKDYRVETVYRRLREGKSPERKPKGGSPQRFSPSSWFVVIGNGNARGWFQRGRGGGGGGIG